MTEVAIVETPNSPEADEAARAAAAAAAASDAATHVAALATVEAANVTESAREEIASYEERLAQCHVGLSTLSESQGVLSGALESLRAETSQTLGSLAEQISLIQSRLETQREPQVIHLETPPNGQELSPPQDQAPPSAPEPSPERRKAHRWI